MSLRFRWCMRIAIADKRRSVQAGQKVEQRLDFIYRRSRRGRGDGEHHREEPSENSETSRCVSLDSDSFHDREDALIKRQAQTQRAAAASVMRTNEGLRPKCTPSSATRQRCSSASKPKMIPVVMT